MFIWNKIASYTLTMPTIDIAQGILLWAIMAVAYFTFRKEKVVVCMKSPQGLSEDELKAVFADIKKQSETDPILKALMKSREAELKIKHYETMSNDTEKNEPVTSDSSNTQ
jgi:hypothetical protein